MAQGMAMVVVHQPTPLVYVRRQEHNVTQHRANTMRHKATICLSLLLVTPILSGGKTLSEQMAEDRAARMQAIARMSPQERQAYQIMLQEDANRQAANQALINQGQALMNGSVQAPVPTTRLQTTCVQQGVHLICQ